MTIVVTGATGHFGRHAVEALLDRGVPAGDIVAIGRQIDKIADLAERGVVVEHVSYDDREALTAAFQGADKVLFVSGSEVGKRIAQHTNIVEAAKAGGVGQVLYTSIPKADTTDMKLAGEHLFTEKLLIESGLPYAFLRNGWYVENYDLAGAVGTGGIVGAADEGRISIVPRADLAEAAAAAVLADNAGRVYELGGVPHTLVELAAAVTEESGTTVTYTDLGEQGYAEFLTGVGLDAQHAAILADSDRAASRGALEQSPADLEELLGRPATPLNEAVRAALKN